MKYFPECLYSDDTQLVGGDLTPSSTPVTSTNACIDLCRKTEGCKYWTVTKGEKDQRCQLKAWQGRMEAHRGYISGSLPSACCECSV